MGGGIAFVALVRTSAERSSMPQLMFEGAKVWGLMR